MCTAFRSSWLFGGSAVLGAALLAWPGQARATFSVVAADPESGQVGGAGASCVGSLDVSQIAGLVPGVGALHAQGSFNEAARDMGVSMLGAGSTPAEVVAMLTSPAFDPLAQMRQYGVVTLAGGAAGHTGTLNTTYAADRQGEYRATTMSLQGNILTSAAVLDQMEQSLLAPEACDLPGRLLAALEAGARMGQGDERCVSASQIAADSAFMKVLGADGSTVISIAAVNTGHISALFYLRMGFDAWRADHPCPADWSEPDGDAAVPVPLDASTDAASDAAEGDPMTDAGAPPPGGAVRDATVDANLGDAGTDALTQQPDAGLDAQGSTAAGCDCEAAGPPDSASCAAVALAIMVVSRRRRQAGRRAGQADTKQA
jgi:uncharacterized Ntn-hydrolase superfamily protein